MSCDIGEFWRNKGAITVPQCHWFLRCGLYAIGIAELCPKTHPERITKKLKEHIQKYNTNFECEIRVDDNIDLSNVGVTQKVKFEMAAKDMVKFERLNPDLRIKVLGARTDQKSFTTLKSDTKSKSKRLFCDNCYTQYFYSKDKLEFHREQCLKNEVQKCTMPKPGTILKFKNYKNMLFVPVVVYSDFECYQDTKHTPSGH